jgi:hypothetical protein
VFAPGHDQRLRSKLESSTGGVIGLARLVDAAEKYANNQIELAEFETVLRRTFRK